jgi:tRNA pseudouridine38-40 synthase
MRLAAILEYDGTAYHGWQRQTSDIISIQEKVEAALSKVADQPISIVCAGRTDAGVHAYRQVIHFDTTAERSERAWVLGTNSNLPHDISLKVITVMADDFHARFSALARRYQYRIYNDPIRPALNRNYVTWHCKPLDVTRMQLAAQKLLGEHDFSSFRAKDCQAKSPIKTIQFFNITQHEKIITLDIQATAFLHHMVRNIAGVLMAIGGGEAEPEWIDELLIAKNRAVSGVTAPPTGLHFFEVIYPPEFLI